MKNWTEKVIIFNSYDANGKYLLDKDFKEDCFLYACLSEQ